MNKNQDGILTDEILKGAAKYAKKKMFKKGLPIVVVKDNKMYHLYKDNTLEFLKELEIPFE